MKIVILDCDTISNNDIDLDILKNLGEVTIYGSTTPDQTIERVADNEVVLTNKVVIDKNVMEKCSNLKYVGIFATGYNNVDLTTAKEKGIVVCNAPGYSTTSVMQQVFAYILAFANRVSEYAQSVKGGDWVNSPNFTYYKEPTFEIMGKTLGIVGFGTIGKEIYKVAKAFGMKVMVYTRTKPQGDFDIECVSLEELLKNSDFVTLHCPLTEQTSGLINYERVSMMKKTAFLINTARGPIINEAEFAKAMNDGLIAGAALDVVSKEPMEASNPLINAKNTIITPHNAWAPLESRLRLIDIVIDNFKAFEKGQAKNIV